MITETVGPKKSGWGMVMFLLLLLLVSIYGFVTSVAAIEDEPDPGKIAGVIVCALAFIIISICSIGFFIVEPNQAVVLILFGRYNGTVKDPGFWWVNPFTLKRRLSLRVRNFDSEKLKVNDKKGNPIEISAVVVWRIKNTAQATFDVEDYAGYVHVQSESAVRKIATEYPYDHTEGEPVSLLSSIDEVSHALGAEIQERIQAAGVFIEEARIKHLAYAPEIAHAMLRRQQAEAIIAARQKIVVGAVGMVEMALNKLNEHQIVHLDEERKAVMVSNLLVVLCGDQATQPVINAGSLY